VNPYGLTGPCKDCPFRSDKPFALGAERRQEIADSMTEGQAEFNCHKTLDYSNGTGEKRPGTQVCGGALVVLAKGDHGFPQLTRIAGAMGMFDPTLLDLEAPVPDSLEEWVAEDPIGPRA
jgi:hypothetical protein